MEVIDPKTAQDAAVNASPANPAAAAPQPDPVKPDNFLPWAIISTILCCLPFGIVAIVYATQVDSSGSPATTRPRGVRRRKNARTWTWVSVGVAAFCWLVYVLLVFVFAAAVSLPFLDL